MFYAEELIEEVRSKNDIVDVISGYVRIQKKGSSYFGLCPFHNEKSASFSVSGLRQMYYCFGCGAGGNVFTFIMEYENFSFPEAMKLLADKAGVTLPEVEYGEEAKRKEGRRSLLLAVNKAAARYFYYQLRSERGALGYRYLTGRSLSEATIKQFGLGYANINADDLVGYLRGQGYDDEALRDSGLASFSEKHGMHDKFWNRVMFPIQDINHRVIGFGGRVMGEGEPKYLNSPETMIFDKSRNLYGLNFARSARRNYIILCEGYLDVIALHQAGFNMAVASLGTAFTAGQANLLRRYTEEVILAYDSDRAGIGAALRAIGILKEVGLSGKVLDLTPYKDPDEFIKNEGPAAFTQRILQAENSFFYELRMLERDYDTKDPEGKTKFHREIARKLCAFQEDVERENYLEAVADKYHIGFENLRRLVVTYAAQTGLARPVERPKSGLAGKKSPEENIRKTQRLLLTWLTEEPLLYPKLKGLLTAADFTDELYRQVAERMFADLEAGTFTPAALISIFADEEDQRQAAAVFNTRLPELATGMEREKAFHDILLTVKKNSYEYFTARLGSDVNALAQAVAGKKALEELAKTHISLD